MLSAALPSPDSALLEAGPLSIHGWSLCVVLGIPLGLVVGARIARARGLPWDLVLSVLLWAAPLAVVGGRLQAVIEHPRLWFGSTGDPALLLSLSTGGLGVWGVLAGGVVGVVLAARSRGVPLSVLADVVALPTLAATAVAVWGQWFSQEGFGPVTTAFWGWDVDPAVLAGAGLPVDAAVQPLFVLSSVWAIIGVVLLHRVFRRGVATGNDAPAVPPGTQSLFGLAWLSAGLTLVAWLRHDVPAERVGAATSSVVGAVITVAAAAWAVARVLKARRADHVPDATAGQPMTEALVLGPETGTASSGSGEAIAVESSGGAEAHDTTPTASYATVEPDVRRDDIAESGDVAEAGTPPAAEGGDVTEASAVHVAEDAPDQGAATDAEPGTSPEAHAEPSAPPESSTSPGDAEAPGETEAPSTEDAAQPMSARTPVLDPAHAEPGPPAPSDTGAPVAATPGEAGVPAETAEGIESPGTTEPGAAAEPGGPDGDEDSPYPTADDVLDGSEEAVAGDLHTERKVAGDEADEHRQGRRRKDS
jgi:prolipoprotein diacylglyceryltransferase